MKTKLLHSTSKTEVLGFNAGELARVKSLSHKVNLDFSNRTAGLADRDSEMKSSHAGVPPAYRSVDVPLSGGRS